MKNYIEYIEINPKVMLGKPVIKGTRLTVELILEEFSSHRSISELLKSYPNLTEQKILAAFSYDEAERLKQSIENYGFPEIIYKFRMWNDKLYDNIIRNKTIRLSSPKELNADYDEAYLPIDETEITETNLQKRALYHARKQYPNRTKEFYLNKAKELRKLMKIEDPEHRKAAKIYAKEQNNQYLGIFCSTITYKDIILWERLAGNCIGFAVGLDTMSIALHESISGTAGFVDYYPSNNIPKIPPFSYSGKEALEKGIQSIFSVPDRYSYEKEFRIARTNRAIIDNEFICIPYEEESRIVQLDESYYREILLGVDISDEDRNEIIVFRNELLSNIPIFTTKIDNGEVIKDEQL